MTSHKRLDQACEAPLAEAAATAERAGSIPVCCSLMRHSRAASAWSLWWRPGTPMQGAAALVTGGNRGFGRAMVEELLDRGAAKVYATARSPHTPADRRIVPLMLDVTDDNSVAAAARAAADVSIVVNNAGVNLNTPVLDAPLADIRGEVETNLFATGQFEVLADETTRTVKAQLSHDLTNLYTQLAAA
jgi:NAD(P)-dependent dehydrogenase (short-subunit alcohol dehydrogenase family)